MIKREKVENLENLTDMEKQTLTALIEGLYAEEGFSDVACDDLVLATGIEAKSIRGVLGSLVKKGYVEVQKWDDGIGEIVYLNADHYNLHPTWQIWDENDNEMIENLEQVKKAEKQYRQMSFGRKDLNKIARKYGIELVKGDGYFYWVALDDVHFEEVSRKVNTALGQSVMIYAFSHCNKAFWVNELNCFVKDACLKEYHDFSHTEHGHTTVYAAYCEEDVWYWAGSGNVVPLDAAERFNIPVNVEKQKAAHDAEVSKSIAEYKKHREENGYSPEEIAEMRAAFGEGVEVGDALTGETFTL